MTLSRFLRDYLYIPLGGSRCSAGRRYLNLFITMLLGGLWHGAGWTFVFWGALHGAYLTINHVWRGLASRQGWNWTEAASWKGAARALTILAVMCGWVIFRAEDLTTAITVLSGLLGLSDAAATRSLVDGSLLVPVLLLTLAVQVVPTIYQFVPDPVHPAAPALSPRGLPAIRWRPTAWQGVALSVLGLVSLSLLTRVKEFLYFQF